MLQESGEEEDTTTTISITTTSTITAPKEQHHRHNHLPVVPVTANEYHPLATSSSSSFLKREGGVGESKEINNDESSGAASLPPPPTVVSQGGSGGSRATLIASWLKENPWNPMNYNYQYVPAPIKSVASTVASRIIPTSLNNTASSSSSQVSSSPTAGSAPAALSERPPTARSSTPNSTTNNNTINSRTSADNGGAAAASSSSASVLTSSASALPALLSSASASFLMLSRGSSEKVNTSSSTTTTTSPTTTELNTIASSTANLNSNDVPLSLTSTPTSSATEPTSSAPSGVTRDASPSSGNNTAMTKSSLLSRVPFSVNVPHTIGGLVSMMRSYSSWAAAYSPSLFRRFSAVRSPADLNANSNGQCVTITNDQYLAFVEKLKKAPKLLNRIENFIIQVLGQDDEVDGLAVEDFLLQMQEALTQAPFYCATNNNDLFLTTECLEKYIMLKIHVKAFPSSDADLHRDLDLYNWIDSLQFIEERNLDLPLNCTAQDYWSSAQDDLFKLSSDKSPIDKLHSIMRCCKHLFHGLQKSKGADEFLPLFVFLLLKSNPPALLSNIAYITKFRNPERLQSELGYYFISLVGAVSFIQNLNPTVLSNIEPHDFERLLAEGRKQSRLRKNSGGAHSSAALFTGNNNISPASSSNSNDDERFETILDNNASSSNFSKNSEDDWVWLKRKGPAAFISSTALLGGADRNMTESQFLAANKFLSIKDPKSLSPVELSELLDDYRRLLKMEYQQIQQQKLKTHQAMKKSLERVFM